VTKLFDPVQSSMILGDCEPDRIRTTPFSRTVFPEKPGAATVKKKMLAEELRVCVPMRQEILPFVAMAVAVTWYRPGGTVVDVSATMPPPVLTNAEPVVGSKLNSLTDAAAPCAPGRPWAPVAPRCPVAPWAPAWP
jgi:hypothetical protein